MSWLALALYRPDLLALLACWLLVPTLLIAGITPTLRAFRTYWDGE